jgi:hypothetical protein
MEAAFTYPLDILAPISGSHAAWRMTVLLPARLPNSHRNGGADFLIFVADPRNVRSRSSATREGATSQHTTLRRLEFRP